MPPPYTFAELSREAGKSPAVIRKIQHALDLHVPAKAEGYAKSYLMFLRKVIALRSLSISLDRVRELLEIEKKVLRLLHVDSLGTSHTWYLDSCDDPAIQENCLMLTGYDIGFPITAGAVQSHLNFGKKQAELFEGAEMGEDVWRLLGLYVQLIEKIKEKVQKERPVLKDALNWANRVFK